MNLLERVLRWALAVSEPAPAKPETDWAEMGCDRCCLYSHTLRGGCAYAQTPVTGAADEDLRDPDSLWGYERGQATQAERLVLDRLAVLSESGSAWDAAVRVFGGAAVAREASREGLSATLAGERRDSVPR